MRSHACHYSVFFLLGSSHRLHDQYCLIHDLGSSCSCVLIFIPSLSLSSWARSLPPDIILPVMVLECSDVGFVPPSKITDWFFQSSLLSVLRFWVCSDLVITGYNYSRLASRTALAPCYTAPFCGMEIESRC